MAEQIKPARGKPKELGGEMCSEANEELAHQRLTGVTCGRIPNPARIVSPAATTFCTVSGISSPMDGATNTAVAISVATPVRMTAGSRLTMLFGFAGTGAGAALATAPPIGVWARILPGRRCIACLRDRRTNRWIDRATPCLQHTLPIGKRELERKRSGRHPGRSRVALRASALAARLAIRRHGIRNLIAGRRAALRPPPLPGLLRCLVCPCGRVPPALGSPRRAGLSRPAPLSAPPVSPPGCFASPVHLNACTDCASGAPRPARASGPATPDPALDISVLCSPGYPTPNQASWMPSRSRAQG